MSLFLAGLIVGIILARCGVLPLLRRLEVRLGLRSRCCGAPLEEPLGWNRLYCSACHRRVR